MSVPVSQNDQNGPQEDIALQVVTSSGDVIVVPTDEDQSPPPYVGPHNSGQLTPLVGHTSRRNSQHSKTDETGSAHDLDLAPDALNSLTVKNQFTVRKMAAQGLIDVALMMANISQLRTLITAGSDLDNYELLLTMVCFSLAAQIVFAVIIFVIYMREAEDTQREEFMAALGKGDVESLSCAENTRAYRTRIETKFRRHQITNRLNFVTIVLVFVITVVNMFITGFGIKLSKNRMGEQDFSFFEEGNRKTDMKSFNVSLDSFKMMPMDISSTIFPYFKTS